MKSGHTRMSVQAIVPLITAKSQSKLEMVRAIWFWLCHNIGKSGPTVSQSRGGAESPFLECSLLDFGSSCPWKSGWFPKNQAPGSDWCVITSLTVSPWQGGRSEQRGDPRVQPRTVCPWRSAVPAAEEQPHVERSAAGRTVVVPGCLLGRGHV